MNIEQKLKRACAQLAEEEAQRLESSLTDQERWQAEKMFRQQKDDILKLIEKNTKKHRSSWGWVQAACILLVLGAVSLFFLPPPKEQQPLSLGDLATAAPYYTVQPAVLSPSPVPTLTPTPVPVTPSPLPASALLPGTMTPEPMKEEKMQDAPTNKAENKDIQEEIPTNTPDIPKNPLPSPTPTAAPALPEPSYIPTRWIGDYYPRKLPEGFAFQELWHNDGSQTVEYIREDQRLRFTEYGSAVIVSIPEGASLSYVNLTNEKIALRMETKEGITLAWEEGDRTLALFFTGEHPEDIARTVEKIR